MKTIYRYILFMLILFVIHGCGGTDDEITDLPADGMYFPPVGNEMWESTTASSLAWNTDKLGDLNNFLIQENSKSFMILVNGRIVIEEYFNGHDANQTWQWNSAGKTLVTATTGIAQQEGLLDINNKVADYLGDQWTSEPQDKEDLIQPYHLLTMTSGINDEKELIIRSNLTYLEDAGSRWSYHNVFQRLMDVVGAASNKDFRTYFSDQLENEIGMEGFWYNGLIFKIYHSNTRSMARFGLLALNMGLWDEEQVVDENFFIESINSSQNINPSYGYMWWLNGKSQFMLPGSQEVFQGPLVPNAPGEMYAAMGFAEQRVYVVPSRNMVVIRMGEASNLGDSDFALSGFDNALWAKINAVIN
ncbi:MAG: serine hydrolase [Bacteroidia bacterium]|nr:serine hydrolase [Bacteroidia bacterium]